MAQFTRSDEVRCYEVAVFTALFQTSMIADPQGKNQCSRQLVWDLYGRIALQNNHFSYNLLLRTRLISVLDFAENICRILIHAKGS